MLITKENNGLVFSEERQLDRLRYEKGLLRTEQAFLAEEIRLTVEANGKILGVIQSSSHDLPSLITGYLLSERIISSASEITKIDINAEKSHAILQLNAPISTAVQEKSVPQDPVLHKNIFSLKELCSYHHFLDNVSTSHHRTHGVHEGFIIEDGNIIAFAEDIGRHNVLDRLRGIIDIEQIDTSDKVLVFSGRVPYSVITKVHAMGFPIMLSRAVPTSLGIAYAKAHNITVISGLRPEACNIFTHPERLKEYEVPPTAMHP